MGRAKTLLSLAGDQKGILLDRAIELGRVLSRDVRVVSGAWYSLMRFRCTSQPSAWVQVPDWHQGLAASLIAGISRIGPLAPGVFVLLADQPLLDADSLRALRKAVYKAPGQPFAANYNGRPGVPAYLPRQLWPEVMALRGDRGAGRILARARATLVDIPGVYDDVDTPEDWRRIKPQISQTVPITRQYPR
jgi:molybdenum cofactor cytidylyltransferase